MAPWTTLQRKRIEYISICKPPILNNMRSVATADTCSVVLLSLQASIFCLCEQVQQLQLQGLNI